MSTVESPCPNHADTLIFPPTPTRAPIRLIQGSVRTIKTRARKGETGTHTIKVKLSRQDNILSDIAARFPPDGVSIFKRLPARAGDLSGGLSGRVKLMPMPHANPFFAHIHLLFALLNRVFALWTHGKPPVRLQRLMERTGRALADDIRATLTEDGVAFPALDDRAFLKWFAKTAPGLGPQAIPGTRRQPAAPRSCL
jgi:hypothetical protein